MHAEYVKLERLQTMPRLPLEGNIDLTYRCNNNCRHCWLRIPLRAQEKSKELSFNQIKHIVIQARSMGCRRWSISGGEPMLRPDFLEIFNYITNNSSGYSFNTNGSLITPKIAQAMKLKGNKMVALYGATAKVHDYITRNPGSFAATMRGFRYLKEAGAGFTVQLIPMRDNYHQFKKMITLAQSLSKHYRVGAAWLFFSACGSNKINKEIARQRLSPKEVIELDKPDLTYDAANDAILENTTGNCSVSSRDSLFSGCINTRSDFHIDAYGQMTFCSFIKDPKMRYDLRKGNFSKAWDEFIPSLADKVKASQEYNKNCGSCVSRQNCRWCPVYGFLEHRRFGAKVDYLCAVAEENKKFKENWTRQHRRYYKIADITIQVDSDLPIKENTFHPKFKHFAATGPAEDSISIRHHFGIPDMRTQDLGKEIYRKAPWAVYKKQDSWVYLGISPQKEDRTLHCAATFNQDHSRAQIYNARKDVFLKGKLHSLTLFPTDQILIARILADRQGFYLHSSGVNFEGKGLLFAGHSSAGKSTISKMFRGKAEILCDDRIIIRKKNSGFNIYGTWSHGTVPDVSGGSAPLRGIFFLEKAKVNRIIPLNDKKEIIKRLLSCLVRPFVTVDWWEKTLMLIEELSNNTPCYILKFDKSGKIIDVLRRKI